MGMEGDLINGICYSLFLPAYLWLWLRNPDEPGAALINSLFLVVACSSWISWYRQSIVASSLANLVMAASIACMNIYQWPHKGEIVVFPQYLWVLLIVSFNTILPFWVKMGITASALGMALMVSFVSPLLSVLDALPTLLGATTVHVMFHYFAERTRDHGAVILNARFASFLLAGAFSYHLTLELSKMMQVEGYAMEGGYTILKAGLFASLGLAAAGAFQKTEANREELETLVVERTHAVAVQAEELNIVAYALQASETAIAITDAKRTIVWANPALERLTNYSEQVRGNSLTHILHLSREMGEQLDSCFDPNGPGVSEFQIGDMNFLIDVAPFPSEGVKWCPDCKSDFACPCHQSRFLVAIKDITEQRARERAEKVSEQQLYLKQGMRESMETLSHELRSPLQGIMGMASCLLDNDGATKEEARESLSIIMASSRHLLTLINNLLDVRKCEAKMMDEFPLAPIPLASSVRDATSFCRPMAAVTNIQLELTLDPSCGDLQVQSNTVRLQQVLINLVSNSIKYAPPKSTVQLTAKVMDFQQAREMMTTSISVGVPVSDMSSPSNDTGPVAVISVRDSGPGISEKVAGMLFGKFSQVPDDHASSVIGGNRVAQPSGTGLGLNLCLKFLQRMNGNIWISNNKEGGACFSFCIPIVEGKSDQQQQQLLSTSSHTSKRDFRNIKLSMVDYKVLVVDDTIINLKVLERMLKNVVTGKVTTASSGKEALSILESESFDLVITDIQMPEMDGLGLTEAIRRNDKIEAKPIVVGLTAETSEMLQERCTKSGISHVLHKPLTAVQLQNFMFDARSTLQRCDVVATLQC